MRAIPTKYISDNQRLGENLYNSKGNIILKEVKLLSNNLIDKINLNKIYTVYI